MSASPEPEPRLAAASQLRELTKAECFELLANTHLGRLAVLDDLRFTRSLRRPIVGVGLGCVLVEQDGGGWQRSMGPGHST